MTGRILMGLHFIFGAAGTGKTRRCCEEIRDYVTSEKDALLFPRAWSGDIYRRTYAGGYFPGPRFYRCHGLRFSRLAYRVFNELRSLCKMLFLRWASRSSSAASLRNTGTSCKCSWKFPLSLILRKILWTFFINLICSAFLKRRSMMLLLSKKGHHWDANWRIFPLI